MSPTEQASTEDLSRLTPEQRLKALLFQYSKLYARWAEDREEFNSGMATHEETLKDFAQKIEKLEAQIERFDQLEPHVRQNLLDAVKSAASSMASSINGKIGDSVTSAIDKSVKKLEVAIEDICRAGELCQQGMQNSQIKTFLVMMAAGIASSLLTVWLLVPKPIMPLSGNDLHDYVEGVNIHAIWPTLSRRTQREIDEAARKNFSVGHPFGGLSSGDNQNGGDEQKAGNNQ